MLVTTRVFICAFLLFCLEPFAGSELVNLFGSAFYVWTTALMFFQAVLCAGYAYAHFLPTRAHRVHSVVFLLGAVGLFLPRDVAVSQGTFSVLWFLTKHYGVAFFALASTGVILQARAALEVERTNRYGLYAISNAGSLVALVVFPLLLEPWLPLSYIRFGWIGAFGVLALLVAHGLMQGLGPAHQNEPVGEPSSGEMQRDEAEDKDAPVTGRNMLIWIALAAVPSLYLSSLSNVLVHQIGSIPLVWIPPLAAYLVSFIVAFADRGGFAVRLWPVVCVSALFIYLGGLSSDSLEFSLHVSLFFLLATAVHTALFWRRPAPEFLALYYTLISVGGVIGGAFVALVAPYVFVGLTEFPLSLALVAIVMAAAQFDLLRSWFRPQGAMSGLLTLSVAILFAFRLTMIRYREPPSTTVARARSPYGHYRVRRSQQKKLGTVLDLFNGQILHGRELTREPGVAQSYYHPTSSFGELMEAAYGYKRSLELADIGLGVGSIAYYARPSDRLTFFEIDPLCEVIARKHFTYLAAHPNNVGVEIGDGRARMDAWSEHKRPPFDVMLVDAFTGDAIPTHLLTREALRVYLRALRPDGALFFHVSNRYFDLRAPLSNTGIDVGLLAFSRDDAPDDDAPAADGTRFVALVRPSASFWIAELERIGFQRMTRSNTGWTDDFHPLLRALAVD